MIRPLVLVFAILAALPSSAAEPRKMYSQKPGVTVHENPGDGHRVVIELRKGQELLELQRIAPGRRKILQEDFSYREMDIPEASGSWAYVGVAGTGGKSGWVRTLDIGPDMPKDVKRAREAAEYQALMTAIDRFRIAPCSTALVFTRLFGAWYVKAPGTSAIAVDRWLGATDYSYRVQKLVNRLGGGRDVPMTAVLKAIGDC